MIRNQNETFLIHYTSSQLALRRFVMAHVPDFQEAEDVLQKASLVLWEKYGEFTGEGSFQAWAFGVTRREILHARRSSARRRLLLVGNLAKVVEERLEVSAPHMDHRRAHLDECIKRLPLKTRDALQAKYTDGLSAEDLAKSIGMQAEAVRALLYRARQAIARCLEFSETEASAAKGGA